jgi:competence protein ComEC
MQYIDRRDFIKLVFTLPLLNMLYGCSGKNRTESRENCLTWTSINVCSATRQGDSHLISKHGKHYLIDGGHPEVTQSHFLPFLRKNRISHLDAVMINHPHSDHYGGIKALFENGIKVDRLYMNMPTEQQMKAEWYGGDYKDLVEIRKLAAKNGTPISPIKQGDIFRFDEQSWMEVLYVYDGFHTPVGHTDINDMSAITLIRDGENRFLLTGDLNKALGGWLAEHGENLKADVVKMPHHGTEDLAPNSFFEKVSPGDIIVTAPQRLWCSKRSKRVRDLAEKYHYGVYVNGIQGNITVASCGKSYTISTEKRGDTHCTKDTNKQAAQ